MPKYRKYLDWLHLHANQGSVYLFIVVICMVSVWWYSMLKLSENCVSTFSIHVNETVAVYRSNDADIRNTGNNQMEIVNNHTETLLTLGFSRYHLWLEIRCNIEKYGMFIFCGMSITSCIWQIHIHLVSC